MQTQRPCFYPGCPYLTTGRYCTRHEQLGQRSTAHTPSRAYAHLYDAWWREESHAYLDANPWCVCPSHQGKRPEIGGARAEVVDHKVPHKGNRRLFRDKANWQSLTKHCHDSWKKSVENAMRGDEAPPRWFPTDLRPSAIPVTLVCGPPGSGKTTWVSENAASDDTVIDLDRIRASLLGVPISHGSREGLVPALVERNKRIKALASATRGRAWLIVGAPTAGERAAWQTALGIERVVVMETPAEICAERIAIRNPGDTNGLARAARRWWKEYEPRSGEEVVKGVNRIFQGGGECQHAGEYFDSVRVSNPFLLA